MAKGTPVAKGAKDSTATIGFEVTALRDSAFPPRVAILRSLSAAKNNRCLTAESRSEAEPERGGIEAQRRQPKANSPAYFPFNKPRQTVSSRLPAGRAQRGNFVESRGGVTKCEVRIASVKVKTSRPFVIRNSSFDIFPGPEHADTFRQGLHPDLRADTATRVSAKPNLRSHLAGLLRSERQLLANPPFNDSDTALRASAFLQTGGTLQVMAERQDNFRKDDDVRWQPSGARQIAKGNPQGERGGVHQFGVPPKGNANFAWGADSRRLLLDDASM